LRMDELTYRIYAREQDEKTKYPRCLLHSLDSRFTHFDVEPLDA